MVLYIESDGRVFNKISEGKSKFNIGNIDFEAFNSSAVSVNQAVHPDIPYDELRLDYFCNQLDKDIPDSFNHLIIELSADCNGFNLSFAVQLASHIALHSFSNIKLDPFSVTIIGEGELNLKLLKECPVLNFFYLDGTHYLDSSKALEEEIDPLSDTKEYGVIRHLRKATGHLNPMDLEIKAHRDSRHGIANEWGALILAENAGLNPEEINYKFPPTLYFKYLLRRRNSVRNGGKIKSSDKSLDNFNGKVLFLDDNSHKGWGEVIKELFQGSDVDVKSSIYDLIRDGRNRIELKEDMNIGNYSLILLDLYLPLVRGKTPSKKHGLKILKLLKEQYPHIPVIAFTASNKSWTLKKTIELGVDGLYVKDSPELLTDVQRSQKQFEDFCNAVSICREKHDLLLPFWKRMEELENNGHFNEFQEIKGKYGRKLGERITERLKMFFGILKRGHEQTKFNQEKFFFSNYELAYLTLWSCLNDISELLYTKESKGLKSWSLSFSPEQKLFWEEKENKSAQSDESDDSQTIFKSNFKCFPHENKFRRCEHRTEVNYARTLYIQMAFIINHLEEKGTKFDERIDQNLGLIFDLNDKRNKLFLTHGKGSEFFTKTEQEKRSEHSSLIGVKDIKNLFNLIFFILSDIDPIEVNS